MKAITIWQPWASLIAAGVKRIETRSCSTAYRGPLAIHAALQLSISQRYLCSREPFRSALMQAGLPWSEGLRGYEFPLGAVVAVVQLAACIRITDGTLLPPEPERSLGEYRRGRWMWVLRNVRRLPRPVRAVGQQGLWEWEEPAPMAQTLPGFEALV